jgi:hypothetical protein
MREEENCFKSFHSNPVKESEEDGEIFLANKKFLLFESER